MSLFFELGDGGKDSYTHWRIRIIYFLAEKVNLQLTELANKESEQQIAVVVGIPTEVRTEKIPQYALDDSSRSHCRLKQSPRFFPYSRIFVKIHSKLAARTTPCDCPTR